MDLFGAFEEQTRLRLEAAGYKRQPGLLRGFAYYVGPDGRLVREDAALGLLGALKQGSEIKEVDNGPVPD
jgi:hypothetical protein